MALSSLRNLEAASLEAVPFGLLVRSWSAAGGLELLLNSV
eukprot:CAMPEP_0115071308 /NCGR_PEP_ID=MMETSP0227-20121206/13598_1 /TAXON_ID=89957 /ORGANISM="Polarella glacialis, Strain CCMP 1383" /LENGTH=39 /DNA_ID= /DNA_START= /DNA_END= /DNA_ORIENTATION=